MQAFLAHGGQTCTIAGTLGASNRVHRSMLLPLPRFNADKRLEAIAEVPPRLVQGAGPCFASALLTEKLGAMASAEWQSRVVSSDVRTLAAQARVLCVGAGDRAGSVRSASLGPSKGSACSLVRRASTAMAMRLVRRRRHRVRAFEDAGAVGLQGHHRGRPGYD